MVEYDIETRLTMVSLREYFETKLAATEHATRLASAALERRLEGMNEFRDTLRDQAGRFVTRDELTLQIDKLKEQVDELRTFRDRLEGKANVTSVYVAYVLSAIGLIIGVIGMLR